MHTRIQRWGNSLALRIPKAFAAEAQLEQDTLVEVKLVDGQLLIVPVTEASVTLEQLLAGVIEENLHRETATGPAIGQEVG
jgi:antitoxin MazE